jgi:arylformamidase
MKRRYRNMSTAELEREYSPSSQIGGDYLPYIEQYIILSQNARASFPLQEDLAYGHQPSQRLDLFHPGDGVCPIHLFIHGGYWQELSHKESAAMAPEMMSGGVAFAAINYTLAPHASIEEMIVECAQAIQWVVDNAERLNIDSGKISVSGHSAGAQLAAMALIRWRKNSDPMISRLQRLLLISGIYDLTPIPQTSINNVLGLDHDTARELSPMQYYDHLEIPITIAIAEHDTEEFRRQGRDYYQHLKTTDNRASLIDIADKNHFNIILATETFAPTDQPATQLGGVNL